MGFSITLSVGGDICGYPNGKLSQRKTFELLNRMYLGSNSQPPLTEEMCLLKIQGLSKTLGELEVFTGEVAVKGSTHL